MTRAHCAMPSLAPVHSFYVGICPKSVVGIPSSTALSRTLLIDLPALALTIAAISAYTATKIRCRALRRSGSPRSTSRFAAGSRLPFVACRVPVVCHSSHGLLWLIPCQPPSRPILLLDNCPARCCCAFFPLVQALVAFVMQARAKLLASKALLATRQVRFPVR